MSINKVFISGNLTRDAELRATQSGGSLCVFGVAVNDRRRNQRTGEWEDYPNFVDCAMFGTRAEKLQPYLTKGTKVSIEGKLRYSTWEREGQRRSKLDVHIDEIEFMSTRQREGAPQPQQYPADMASVDAQYAAIPTTLPPVDAVPPSVYDEDIPF